MEEEKTKKIEDSNCCFVGKPRIGKTVLAFCSVVLLLFYFVPQKKLSVTCESCLNGKLEPKAVIVCLSSFKIPYSETKLPYSVVKRTLCRCNKCKKGLWVNLTRVENKLNYSNQWGNGTDFDCPFCNGIMKSKMFADGGGSSDCEYQCDFCKRELIIIHCVDKPISWADANFKNVDQER